MNIVIEIQENSHITRLAYALQSLLEEAGHNTCLCYPDPSKTLSEVLSPLNPDRCIGLHLNAYNGITGGSETHTNSDWGGDLHTILVDTLQLRDRGTSEIECDYPYAKLIVAFEDNPLDLLVLEESTSKLARKLTEVLQ